jgi:methyl-accepting chemotaxis protein
MGGLSLKAERPMRDFPELDDGPEAGVYNPSAAIVDAIKRSYGFIQFELDGTIVSANDNFLNAVGYRLDEIVGRHHRIFMPPGEADMPGYREFWALIGRGEFVRGSFRRIRKDGTPIWISATYSPLRDRNGVLRGAFKVVVDLTDDKRLHEALSGALAKLSRGDVRQRITEGFTGDNLATRDAFNTTMDRLQRVFAGVSRSCAGLDSLSQGLTGRALELNQRAGSLAASIERSSTSIRSMTDALAAVSGRAGASDEVARRAAARAEAGSQTVEKVIASMRGIADITGEISKITKVIEGFAFQTNLLSINAAVEAARAGDAGKGFAVVAAEVRSLAERSAKASREIGDLIARGETEVSLGVAQVTDAGRSLSEINEAVGEMVDSTARIARDLADQSREIDELRRVLAEMERETGHLTTMAGQNDEAAAAVSSQVAALSGGVRRFLGEG